MKLVLQLFTPLKYLHASNGQKAFFDWWAPSAISAVLCGVFVVLPGNVIVLGSSGLVSGVNELLQVLVGFYIAALAAVSTFNSASLDQKIAGDPVRLVSGDGTTRELSRRIFLSLMFSYLAFLSMAVYVIGLIGQISVANLVLVAGSPWFWIIRAITVYCYVFLICQLMSITLLSLYYLGDRIHRADPEPIQDPDPTKIEPVHGTGLED